MDRPLFPWQPTIFVANPETIYICIFVYIYIYIYMYILYNQTLKALHKNEVILSEKLHIL